MRRRALPCCALALLVGCGGGSPTSPSSHTPSVAGTYTGTTTITYPEVPAQLHCPSTVTVTQSGLNVTFSPLILNGDCGGVSAPLGATTITTSGSLAAESGTFNEPSCGTYQYTGSGGFFGNQLQLSISASSATCLDFNFTATLNKS